MPLTKSGESILRKLKKKYGSERGEGIFYAMINKKARGTEKWHGKKE